MKRMGGLNSESLATLWILCTVLALAPIVGSVSSPKHQFRGISPQGTLLSVIPQSTQIYNSSLVYFYFSKYFWTLRIRSEFDNKNVDEMYYKSSDTIKCRDGSNKFSKAQLNDDYCDCPDGTDEPGIDSAFFSHCISSFRFIWP